jgi:hypothetical protein
MRHLPLDKHARPIPWFVYTASDGTPDHRVAREACIRDAIRFSFCWICGTPRGTWVTFPIGPMCGINHISAEPPSHKECALYSAQVCPFLTTPTMVRRPKGLDGAPLPPGESELRNPGVILLWTTRTWTPFNHDGGVLFQLGEPLEVQWLAQGRPATRAEVLHSIDTGMPRLIRSTVEQLGEEGLPGMESSRTALIDLAPAV